MQFFFRSNIALTPMEEVLTTCAAAVAATMPNVADWTVAVTILVISIRGVR